MRRLPICIFLICCSFFVSAQSCRYEYVETTAASSSVITFKINVFCTDKKNLDKEASLAAVRCVMFDGIPKTQYAKALVSDGEKTSMQQYPKYYESLYSTRYSDFVPKVNQLSKFKQSGVEKATLFEVTVKASNLRKDLESNNIKIKFGL